MTSSTSQSCHSLSESERRGEFSEASPPESRIYSVGASLTWTPSDALWARVTYGHALRDVEVAGNKDIQDRGFHARVTVRPLRLLR